MTTARPDAIKSNAQVCAFALIMLTRRDGVIGCILHYENKARKQMGLPKKPYDETHNKTVKKGVYEN